MKKDMYRVWAWGNRVGERILMPFHGSSGISGVADAFLNVICFPLLVPFALPFFGLAKLMGLGFRTEHQVVIPKFSGDADEPTTYCVPKVNPKNICVLVVPDGSGSVTFPTGKTVKNGSRFDPKSLGINDGHIFQMEQGWDDRRGVFVVWHLMVVGTVPCFGDGCWVPLSELGGSIPELLLEKMTNHRQYFEHWLMKFDLRYPTGRA